MTGVWAGSLLPGADLWQYTLDCQVAELQKEYCVDRLTGEHMVMASRYATNGAADLTAKVRRAVGEGWRVDCARVAGICHVRDVYARNLGDSLECMHEEELGRSGRRYLRRIERDYREQIRQMRLSSFVLALFSPFRLSRCGEHLEKKRWERGELAERVTNVFRATSYLGGRSDADLARSAITMCDNRLLSTDLKNGVWHDIQQAASTATHYEVKNCHFSMAFYRGVWGENVRRVWVSDLGVLPTMLKRYCRLMKKGQVYVPFEHSIVTLFTIGSGSGCSSQALKAAKRVARSCRVGMAAVSAGEALLLRTLVERHADVIDADRCNIPLAELCRGAP